MIIETRWTKVYSSVGSLRGKLKEFYENRASLSEPDRVELDDILRETFGAGPFFKLMQVDTLLIVVLSRLDDLLRRMEIS